MGSEEREPQVVDGLVVPEILPACTPDELRDLFLFEKLTEDQLRWLSEHGHCERVPAGLVYREGDHATQLYVLLEGTVTLARRVGADDVEVTRSSQVGVYAGAMQAYLGDRVPQAYLNSLRAAEPSRFFVLDARDFTHVVDEWFPMALHLLEGLFFGMQNSKQAVDQRERLLALGSLSAGLTHELNNPAAAAARATSSLRERVAGMRHKLALIAAGPWDRSTLETLVGLQEDAVELVSKAQPLDPVQAADREDELTAWLDGHGLANGWDIAPTFVQAGFDVDWLEKVAETVDASVLEGAVRWLSYSVETELLMNEIEDSTARIPTLVSAARQYSQVDRAPYQVVDLHELLDSTLVMLAGKLGPGVRVVKEYDRSLPRVPVYAGDLNQVWTNLVDNAAAAMGGHGTLTVRTALDGDRALVEIADTGTGIPPDVLPRVFDPFFTTKPVGEGTGLGLDISWRIVVGRHHGDLRVESVPGDTRFQVRLPLEAVEE